MPEAAAAVAEIKKRLLDAGCDVPDHRRLSLQRPRAADEISRLRRALDKYRINPGNVGHGQRRDEQFSTICKVARDNGKPVRIGVNGGSLNQELVMRKMQENTDQDLGRPPKKSSTSAWCSPRLQSTELALECGLAQGSNHYFLQGFAAAAT